MIYLLSDFGYSGPYIGQMKAVLYELSPKSQVIDLLHDLPQYDVQSAAYLLPALLENMPVSGSVYLCVVDPGVGSARGAIALKIGLHWFIGPDNGLFDRLALQYDDVAWFDITWRPAYLSHSFHGRDLFAPVAAAIENGQANDYLSACDKKPIRFDDVDLAQIIYIDHFGNLITGIRADNIDKNVRFHIAGKDIIYAEVFSAVAIEEIFWYKNSMGLVELAVNQGSAQQWLNIAVGDQFRQL